VLVESQVGWPPHGLVEIGPIIEVFVAAGALDPDDPALVERRATAAAINDRTPTRSGVPPRWASILSRRPDRFHQPGEDDPIVTAIAATLPPIDGTYLRIEVLERREDSFSVLATLSPPPVPHHLAEGPAPGLVWWGDDDRGNHYLGAIRGFGSQGGEAIATVLFDQPLDPAATSLRLLPTGPTQRGVVTIPLSDDRRTDEGHR
jgi:hypothetical protein